nr:hypothetical protein [Ezakiella coagulans]
MKKLKIEVISRGCKKETLKNIKEKNFCFACGCFQGNINRPEGP